MLSYERSKYIHTNNIQARYGRVQFVEQRDVDESLVDEDLYSVPKDVVNHLLKRVTPHHHLNTRILMMRMMLRLYCKEYWVILLSMLHIDVGNGMIILMLILTLTKR